MLKEKWPKSVFGHELCDLLVLDEASQMSLPEAIMAALPLKAGRPADRRRRPPADAAHRQARLGHARPAAPSGSIRSTQSLFDTLRAQNPPMIQFAESFRLHAAMAEFLRQEVYRHDGIAYHSKKRDRAAGPPGRGRPGRRPCCDPDYPLVVVVHDEADSQVRNPFEQALIEPILRALADPARYGLDAVDGLGIVVPHRAQRAALQQAFPELCIIDPASGLPVRSAIDTVERFQGGERTVILVSATESDRAYLLASSDVPARPPPADGGLEPGEAEDDPGRLPEHLLAVQPGRGDVRQLAAVEEPAAADLHDAAVGGRAGREAGGGVGMS